MIGIFLTFFKLSQLHVDLKNFLSKPNLPFDFAQCIVKSGKQWKCPGLDFEANTLKLQAAKEEKFNLRQINKHLVINSQKIDFIEE